MFGGARGIIAVQRIRRGGTSGVALFLLIVVGACAPPPQANQADAVCPAVKAPVCAVHRGEKQSYWNECEARRDRAILAIPGECPIPYGYDVGAL